MYEHLEDLDIDPRQVFDGLLVAHIETLLEAPDFIREAQHLSLEERVPLHFARATAPPDVIDRAKRETLTTLGQERSETSLNGSEHPCGPAYVLGVFCSKMRTLLEAAGYALEPRCFDREELLQSFDAAFDWPPADG